MVSMALAHHVRAKHSIIQPGSMDLFNMTDTFQFHTSLVLRLFIYNLIVPLLSFSSQRDRVFV